MRALPIRAGLTMVCALIAVGAGALPARADDGSWDTTLRRLGDPAQDERSGDVRDFSRWTMAHDDALTLVAAYRAGSAFGEDNRWFNTPGGNVSWQALWQPGGRAFAPGARAGGTWRIGASDRPADRAFADRLADELAGS